MATVVTMDDCQKAVVSILQASRTAYGAGATGDSPDGSNRMFSSATEIDDAILYADAEICTLMCNTLQHPFQTTFIQTSSVLGRVAPLPARNGMILRVYGLSGDPKNVVSMDDAADSITVTTHGLTTGDLIQFITTGTVGGGLTINTDYYVIVLTASTFRVATSYLNAVQGTYIVLNATAPVSSQIIEFNEALKARTADEIKEAIQNPALYGTYSAPWFFVEGDYLYLTGEMGRVIYTDYTKTSAPQAPEPYRNAIVAGAVARLVKDGADESVATYYNNLYSQYLQMVASGNKVLPDIAAYAIAGGKG